MFFDSDIYDFSFDIFSQGPTWEQSLPWDEETCAGKASSLVDYFDNGGQTEDYDKDGDVDLHDLATGLRKEADKLTTPAGAGVAADLRSDAQFYDWLGNLADSIQGDTNQPVQGGGGGPGGNDGGIN